MRRFVLITAMLLMSASARAEGPRGLSTVPNSEPAVAAQAKPAETPNADAPQVAERSSPAEAAAEQPNADRTGPDQARPNGAKSASSKMDKSKSRRDSLETRVIDELHRRGIYW